MAYNNYAAPPGAYNPNPPGYGPPPGFGPPPTMNAAPGMPAPSPAAMQAQFQPPNMPNINLNAPIIRLGVDGPQHFGDRMGGDRGGREGRGNNGEPMGNRGRAGLGADQAAPRNLERQREQVRESMMALQPPTKEEVARTIFIGGLSEEMPKDEALQQILSCAGKLRRWTRARDASDKICKFGFAEYEDVESLEAAVDIFLECKVPLFNKDGSVKMEIKKEGSDTREVKKAVLFVVVDEQSRDYIEQWKGRKKESDDARQFRIESCKEELEQTFTMLINQSSHASNDVNGHGDTNGDAAIPDANGEGGEVISIALELDDDLADIPVEMRATVAEEIKAFRERSNRRDMARLRREEDVERQDRLASGSAPRTSRLASSPPLGPASSANGIPIGPRGQQGVQGAPSGPKGFRGAQIPSDYVNGVPFVPGTNGTSIIKQEDEDAEESDEELERRRQEKKDAEREGQYQEAVRRWQNRERQRGAAQERERKRMDAERRVTEEVREDMLVKLAIWNDDDEAKIQKHPYYRDHSAWVRSRDYERHQEEREDDLDREAEEQEKADEQRRTNAARSMADDFLGSMNMGADSKAEQPAAGFGGFKINLGDAAAKTRQAQGASAPKRTVADVEGLLEDEEDAAAAGGKRPELKPLQDTSTLPENGQDLTDEEKAAARSQLASEIPTETEPLFAHPVKWSSISSLLIDTQIRPFVERKVVEYLGVQEDLIVDAVLEGVKNHTPPKELTEELLGPLEDEAEVLVKKVWRLLVFWGECESRGLS